MVKRRFSIAGLYSLEDDYVRLYVYVILGNREEFLDHKIESSLEKALLGLFSDKYLRQFTKRLKKVHLGIKKDTQKACQKIPRNEDVAGRVGEGKEKEVYKACAIPVSRKPRGE